MPFAVKEKMLPGGLRTVVLPRTDLQSVTFLVLVGVGSRYETPRQAGLSHFLEHMFFKGTEKRPTTKEISEAIDNVGGQFNAFTGQEYTGYYVKVAQKHLRRGADVVSDILLRPLFPAEEIERERGVIIEEIRMYTDQPMRHVEHLAQEALFGTHPLGRRIDGSEKTVSAFKRADFVQYTSGHYHTGNTVVAVAGAVDSAKTQKLLADLLSPLPVGKATKPKVAPKKSPAKRLVFERRPQLDQTHLILATPGPKMNDNDRWAATLLSVIVGGGMSSRLFIEVRERRGLAYAVRMSTDEFTDTGALTTQAGVRTDKAVEALKVIVAEYDRVVAEPVTEDELAKAKQMVRGQLLLGLEETNALANFAAGQLLLEGSITTPAQILKKVEAVTVKDIQRVARKYLDPKKRSLALLGPQSRTSAFEKLLT